MLKYFLSFFVLIFIFFGCSSKQYFEPIDVEKYPFSTQDLNASVIHFNKIFATLDKKKFVLASGDISDHNMSSSFCILNDQNQTIIASDLNQTITLGKNGKNSFLKIDSAILGASIQDNLLAVIMSDNTLGLYDIQKQKFVFKEYQKPNTALDNRIVNPVFQGNLILFPTLNGKIVVVDTKKYEKIKDIIVDTDSQFNNIIFLYVVNDTLIAATRNKIITLTSNTFHAKNIAIVDIIRDKDNMLYIATLNGEIQKLTMQLQVVNSVKYKYANIVGLSFNTNNIYAIEKNGFLIELDKNLAKEKIFSIDIPGDAKVFSNKNTLIIGDKKYILND